MKPYSAVVAIEGERVADLDDAHSESTCLSHVKDTSHHSYEYRGRHENCHPPSEVPVLLGHIKFDFQRFGVYSLTVLGVHLTCLPLVAVC